MFEQSKPTFGLVKLTPYHEVHIYTLGKIFVKDDIFSVRIFKNPFTKMQRTFTNREALRVANHKDKDRTPLQ